MIAHGSERENLPREVCRQGPWDGVSPRALPELAASHSQLAAPLPPRSRRAGLEGFGNSSCSEAAAVPGRNSVKGRLRKELLNIDHYGGPPAGRHRAFSSDFLSGVEQAGRAGGRDLSEQNSSSSLKGLPGLAAGGPRCPGDEAPFSGRRGPYSTLS